MLCKHWELPPELALRYTNRHLLGCSWCSPQSFQDPAKSPVNVSIIYLQSYLIAYGLISEFAPMAMVNENSTSLQI
jgi:hypothetical protein